ncbi:MAG: M1 family metallopeptidase [Candidatus Aenigmarchaeota archaeon]|nr:M1 family metallopeptidase [Candidatus Aenigmarchaeota archaeon]
MKKDSNVKPVNYKIDFEIDLKPLRFSGKESIVLHVAKPTNRIVLNAADLKITGATLTSDGTTLKPRVRLDKKSEELTLRLPKKIAAGDATIVVEFEGVLSDGLAGLYRSRYIDKGKTKYIATTQFEPADARRAFPCFDEPAMKATFDVSVTIANGLKAISNMPVSLEESVGKSKKRVSFERTPKMPTYLFYLGVGEFEFLEDSFEGVTIRVATTPGKSHQGAYAVDVTKKILDYYNKYFGVAYPLPKLDLIAVPDFAIGAMENWGAITFRETAILYDPKTSSKETQQTIAEIVAHELAHQWFGNLVTMKWWNDLWLNESFATWISFKTVAHLYPRWDMWNQFISMETVGALGLDSLKTSHPIEVRVKRPHELIEIFDAISYNKGASVLRMLEAYIGEDAFRKGLQTYIAKHAYANATTEDLWSALESSSTGTVKKMMDTWTKQTGYPFVSVEKEGSTIILEQKRFLLEQARDETLWYVPVRLELYKGKFLDVVLNEKKKWIAPNDEIVYMKANAGQTGFYRVRYTDALLEELKRRIADKRLGSLDRWGVQNDLYALARACDVPFEKYLEFIEAYADEDDYLVAEDVADNLYRVYVLSSGDLRAHVQERALAFYRKQFERLGWDAREGEKENDAFLRSTIITYLGVLGDADVLREAHKRFQKFTRTGALNPDLRRTVYLLEAWQGDARTYATLVSLYKKEQSPEEKKRFLLALAGSQDEALLKKTLEFSLSSAVRTQDMPAPAIVMATNPIGWALVWPWIKENWTMLRKRCGKGGNVKLIERLVETTSVLATLDAERDVRAFFNKNRTPGTEKAVAQSLERIRVNHRFLEKNGGL